MPWEAWVTLITLGLMMLALLRSWLSPDTVLLAGLTVLMTFGVFSKGHLISPSQAVAGFGNVGLMTIAILFVIATGISQTGAMAWLSSPVLGRPRSLWAAQLRLLAPVAVLSAFLNNTAIVAMFIPVVRDWARKSNLSASRLFMPLSYAAILGGTCTLIGTSTNLVVWGLIKDQQAQGQLANVHLNIFTMAVVGVPVTIVGLIYMIFLSPKLLVERKPPVETLEDAKQYTVEMIVKSGGPIAGQTIELAGLRHLPGVYLAEIERNEERLVGPGPETVLHDLDRLIFVGIVESVVDLRKVRGLLPASDNVFKLNDPKPNRCLVEAVLGDSSPLKNKSIREGHFRSYYNAVVIAVHRGGERICQKLGDIVLLPGDTLLLETHPSFVEQHRHRRDFLLVSKVQDSTPIRHERAWLAIVAMLAMILAATLTQMSMLNAALLAAGVMVATGCLTIHDARNSVDVRVLLTIGAGIGVAHAISNSGLADQVAEVIIKLCGQWEPYGILAGIYLLGMLFTGLINNVAAATLLFPIAQVLADHQGYHFTPLAVVIMMSASASFATPVGYQTNMMVYGVGGYRASDYFKFGLPLNFICMAVVVSLTQFFWPLLPV